MKPLHDDNDCPVALVIQALDDLGIKPFVDRTTARPVVDARRCNRIIDHDQIGAAADENMTNHTGYPLTAMRQIEVAAVTLGLQVRK